MLLGSKAPPFLFCTSSSLTMSWIPGTGFEDAMTRRDSHNFKAQSRALYYDARSLFVIRTYEGNEDDG
jgi:hypothetical protein